MRPIVLGSLMVLMFAACGGTASPTGAGAASGVRATLGSPAPAGQAGAISGHLGYPSEFLPGLGVYAISVDGARYYKVESASYQPQYTMVGVPAGDYYVYAASRWPIGSPQERFGAAYTKAVPCGVKVGCDDHSPITVHVTAGSTTPDVDPGDWYAPTPDAYPLIPDGPLPASQLPPATFADAEGAALSLGTLHLLARHVSRQQDCAANAACFWVVGEINGHNASYYHIDAGSNSDLVRCGLLVVQDSPSSWRGLGERCSMTSFFPALHHVGVVRLPMGETGCVRVRKSPGLTAPILQCLKAGTQVVVDGGPYYVPTQASVGSNGPSAVDVWWHLAGRGWMAHEYLWEV